MTEPLLIGTYGWDEETWVGPFYPEELPGEWRFCFYSNRLRSVLLPAAATCTATLAQVAAWREDSDAQFRWVLELPEEFVAGEAFDARLADLRRRFAPVESQIAGLLLSLTKPSLADIEAGLDVLQTYRPVCIDVPAAHRQDAELAAAVAARGAARCWYPAAEAAPAANGEFLIARAPAGDARVLRSWLEALAAWRGARRRAGLFFDAGAPSARAAGEARIIAELLGV